VKFIIADDRPSFRKKVARIMRAQGGEIVAEVNDGAEVLQWVVNTRPDILVQGLNTPGRNGIEVARKIARLGLGTRIVIAGPFDDQESVLECFEAGVRACVHESGMDAELATAIRNLELGKSYLSPQLADRMVTPYPHQKKPTETKLTEIQTKILTCLVEDVPDKEIGRQLGLTASELKAERKAIHEVLQVSNIGGLNRFAIRHGLIAGLDSDKEPD
jgi:DNA-binding NarL/FixJ family response regulator